MRLRLWTTSAVGSLSEAGMELGSWDCFRSETQRIPVAGMP